MQQDRPFFVALVAIVFALCLNAGVSFAESSKPPEQQANNQVSASGTTESSPESREATATEVVAHYTVVLAALTAVLAAVGIVTSGLNLWQILLTRKEFNATHRPKLVVRNVIRDNGIKKFGFLLANKGAAPCTIVESLIVIRANTGDVPIIADIAGLNDLGQLDFAPGQVRRLNLEPKSEGEEVGQAAFDIGFLDTYKMRGVIVYEDGGGIRRRTVFTRILKKDSDVFERVDEPDADWTI